MTSQSKSLHKVVSADHDINTRSVTCELYTVVIDNGSGIDINRTIGTSKSVRANTESCGKKSILKVYHTKIALEQKIISPEI